MSSEAPSPTAPAGSALPQPELGLRERKKQKTRQALRREAYRLFQEQGYEATTVQQIAEAAEVSPSTFFRYFPTKEDLVLSDEYDLMLKVLLRGAVTEDDLVGGLRRRLIPAMREVLAADRRDMEVRLRLTLDVPAIRTRMYESQLSSWQAFADALAEAHGVAPGSPLVRISCAAVSAVATDTMLAWAEGGFVGDPTDMLDEALAHLGRGLRFEH